MDLARTRLRILGALCLEILRTVAAVAILRRLPAARPANA